MISDKLLIILAIGSVAMGIPILVQSIWYRIKLWKVIPVAIMLTIVGTIGTYIMFIIENGAIGGRSFYGAVFFVPVVFLAISQMVRIPYLELVDLCAPAECLMLGIMKYQCFLDGCCGGRTIFTAKDGTALVFPSQIVELVAALLLMVVLIIVSHKERFKGTIYPWYLILYGCVRFVLNIFREDWVTREMLLPFGNIWSLVAIGVGTLWLIAISHKKATKQSWN